MGSLVPELDEPLREFIAKQKMFFVASAPLAAEGHVNLSPKGLDCLRVLGPKTVAYVDFTGSGIETVAHVRENGRLALMFCAFQGPPRILRLRGRGEVVEPRDQAWARYSPQLPHSENARTIIVLHVEMIADSCGYGIPLYDYVGERSQLPAWCERKGPEGIAQYQSQKNRHSIDGLPGLKHVADPNPSDGHREFKTTID
jgi:predicted pyridoxine 5'-phosphate oxidase superfamily flavin-nucleotide-binding protein